MKPYYAEFTDNDTTPDTRWGIKDMRSSTWRAVRYPTRAQAERVADTLNGKRWTLAEIRAVNMSAGFFFFSRDTMKFFGDTMRNFGVVHRDGCVYVRRVRKSAKAGNALIVGALREFNPATGDIGTPVAPYEIGS